MILLTNLIRSVRSSLTSIISSQKRLLSAAKALADATADMVEAAKKCAGSPNNESSQEQLKRAADHIRATTSEAVGATIKRKMIKRLENSSKHAAATATQCIAASQGAGSHNTSHSTQDDLMESCKSVADVIPKLVEGVKYSMQNPNSAITTFLFSIQNSIDSTVALAEAQGTTFVGSNFASCPWSFTGCTEEPGSTLTVTVTIVNPLPAGDSQFIIRYKSNWAQH